MLKVKKDVFKFVISFAYHNLGGFSVNKSSTKVFLTVAEAGSFRKAADILGYTQAGISYIVHGMEEDMGLSLFIRDRSGVRLTKEGETLLPLIKQLDLDNRTLQQTVNELKGLEQGSLRVQIFDSISIHWIPGIVQEFKKDYPDIKIELISEEDSSLAEEFTANGYYDCGFFLTDVEAPLDLVTLHEEKLLAVISPDHELADADVFPVSRLGDFPYIRMKFDHTTGIQDIFDRYGAVPNTAYQLDNDYAALAMASKGHGYCIFPELLLQNVPYEIRCLEFDEPQKRTIRMGTRSMLTASKACLKFMEYVQKWVEDNVK